MEKKQQMITKEQIEELGWEMFDEDEYQIEIDPNKKFVLTADYEDDLLYIEYIIDHALGYDIDVFTGKLISNNPKQELATIMEQVGIITTLNNNIMQTQGNIRITQTGAETNPDKLAYVAEVKRLSKQLIDYIDSAAPRANLTINESSVWEQNRQTAFQNITVASMLAVRNEFI